MAAKYVPTYIHSEYHQSGKIMLQNHLLYDWGPNSRWKMPVSSVVKSAHVGTEILNMWQCQHFSLAFWLLLSRFLNTSDWPLCSRAQQICLRLATMTIASRSSQRAYTDTHASISGSVYEQIYYRSTDSRGFQTLQCVSVQALGEELEAMIIVANQRPNCWARKHSGQSEVFKSV